MATSRHHHHFRPGLENSGRVGDPPSSPPAAASTTKSALPAPPCKGEEKHQNLRRHTIIEMMRKGMSPTDACLEPSPRRPQLHNDKKKLATFLHYFFYASTKTAYTGRLPLDNAYEKAAAPPTPSTTAPIKLVDCATHFNETAVSD